MHNRTRPNKFNQPPNAEAAKIKKSIKVMKVNQSQSKSIEGKANQSQPESTKVNQNQSNQVNVNPSQAKSMKVNASQ
eukprot:7063788-Lingulodinium_polyedra.AAC.1